MFMVIGSRIGVTKIRAEILRWSHLFGQVRDVSRVYRLGIHAVKFCFALLGADLLCISGNRTEPDLQCVLD